MCYCHVKPLIHCIRQTAGQSACMVYLNHFYIGLVIFTLCKVLMHSYIMHTIEPRSYAVHTLIILLWESNIVFHSQIIHEEVLQEYKKMKMVCAFLSNFFSLSSTFTTSCQLFHTGNSVCPVVSGQIGIHLTISPVCSVNLVHSVAELCGKI